MPLDTLIGTGVRQLPDVDASASMPGAPPASGPWLSWASMPRDLAAPLPNRHQPYQVYFPGSTISGASNNPPKDYARWEKLVRVLTAHLVQRYGREEVLKWYFEVWNEPEIGYVGSARLNLLVIRIPSAMAISRPSARVQGTKSGATL